MVKWLKKLNELNGHMGDLNAEFQPSLRDFGVCRRPSPALKRLGYSHLSLRDTTPPIFERDCHSRGNFMAGEVAQTAKSFIKIHNALWQHKMHSCMS